MYVPDVREALDFHTDKLGFSGGVPESSGEFRKRGLPPLARRHAKAGLIPAV